MDIYSFNRLAAMEHELRKRSLPAVPEYDPPNVEIQPGWALLLLQRFRCGLRQVFRPLTTDRTPASSPIDGAKVIKECGY